MLVILVLVNIYLYRVGFFGDGPFALLPLEFLLFLIKDVLGFDDELFVPSEIKNEVGVPVPAFAGNDVIQFQRLKFLGLANF